MDAILHKLCEKAQQELWDLLKEGSWTKDHAEVAYYMVEIVKASKKMEHMKRIDEAMEEESRNAPYRYERGNSGGGNSNSGGGGRSSGGGRSNYEYDDEEEWNREKDRIVAKHFENNYKRMLEDRIDRERRSPQQ